MDVGIFIWPLLLISKHRKHVMFDICTSSLKWPFNLYKVHNLTPPLTSRLNWTKGKPVHFLGITPAFSGLCHHAETCCGIQYCLKLKHRWYTDISDTILQNGWRVNNFINLCVLPCIFCQYISFCWHWEQQLILMIIILPLE